MLLDEDQVCNLDRLGRTLARYLADHNLSLLELEQRTGLHRSIASRLVTGTGHVPSVRTCRRLAAILGLPPEEILRLAGHVKGPLAVIAWPAPNPPVERDPEIIHYAERFRELPADVQNALRTLLRREFHRLDASARVSRRPPDDLDLNVKN
jgi:transcriptional regulator with XRE-family HTH domain